MEIYDVEMLSAITETIVKKVIEDIEEKEEKVSNNENNK